MKPRIEVHKRLRADGSLDAVTVGAYLGDDLAGDLTAYRERGHWRVLNVDVVVERRRRGIATALLERLFEETAGETSCRGYVLQVDRMNDAARKLYERVGFEVTGRDGDNLVLRRGMT